MSRGCIFTLSDLPIVPSSSQSFLPALHDYPLHLLLEVFPYAPDAQIGYLFLRIDAHFEMVVAKLQTWGVVLDRGETFESCYLPIETVATS